jgi:glycosyltransferase domain-containing protein
VKKVAILIPTKDRIDFVIRTIKYYVSINSPHPIFIGDASVKSSEELVLNAAQDKIDVYYFHWENLNDRKTISKVAQEASKTNITDYCAYQGDDDFFVTESLSKCAEFLDDNPTYAASQGRAFSFELNGDGPYGKLKDVGIYWNLKELKGDDALDRLKEISTNYWVPTFSVHRIKEFIEDMSNGIDSVIDRNFGEYVNSLSIAMRGKSKFIDCLYLARGIHSGIDHPTSIQQSHKFSSIFEWFTGENWYLSYTESIISLSEVLSKNDNLSLAESNSEVKLAVEKIIMLDSYHHTSTRKFIRNKYSEYIGKRGFIYILSKFYRRIKYISIFILPCKDFSKRCILSPKSKYYKDVQLILASCEETN